MVVFPFFRHQLRPAIASFLISITKASLSRHAPAQRVERASARDKLHQHWCDARHRLRGLRVHRAHAARGYCENWENGQAVPKGIDGQIVTRVTMGIDVLARLNQQIQKALIGMRDAKQAKPKS
jgi:hypothetical protein